MRYGLPLISLDLACQAAFGLNIQGSVGTPAALSYPAPTPRSINALVVHISSQAKGDKKEEDKKEEDKKEEDKEEEEEEAEVEDASPT
ncbi:hypothetical protein BJ546DRAFT_1073940 [Cryomyces antarcticus]